MAVLDRRNQPKGRVAAGTKMADEPLKTGSIPHPGDPEPRFGRADPKAVDEPINLVDDEQPDLPEVEDASAAFLKQIEALKKSEQTAKEVAEQAQRDRDAAIQRAKDRETEIGTLRQQTVESQADAINAALAAAKSEVLSAKRDIAAAIEAGDIGAQTEALDKLSQANSHILRLEDGKAEIERAAKEKPAEPATTTQAPSVAEQIDRSSLPPVAKTWLKSHSDYFTDPRKNAKIQSFHWDLVDEGLREYSPEYFEAMEVKLGLREAPDDGMVDDEPTPQRRTAMVSAPVSREAPTSSSSPDRQGRITLTAAQKEAAKMAGITETEYAAQVIRLRKEKANGNYSGGQ